MGILLELAKDNTLKEHTQKHICLYKCEEAKRLALLADARASLMSDTQAVSLNSASM